MTAFVRSVCEMDIGEDFLSVEFSKLTEEGKLN